MLLAQQPMLTMPTRRAACVAICSARPVLMRAAWVSGLPASSAAQRAACACAACPSSSPRLQAPSALKDGRVCWGDLRIG